MESVEEYLERGGNITQCPENAHSPLHRHSARMLQSARGRHHAARRQALTEDARKETKLFFLGKRFDLTHAWIIEKLVKGTCEVTGVEFDLESPGTDGKRTNPWAPSIDRINSLGGYTKDNCQVVIWMYNRAKGEDSDGDVLKMAKALVDKR